MLYLGMGNGVCEALSVIIFSRPDYATLNTHDGKSRLSRQCFQDSLDDKATAKHGVCVEEEPLASSSTWVTRIVLYLLSEVPRHKP